MTASTNPWAALLPPCAYTPDGLETITDALVAVRCGNVTLTEGRMGRVADRVAIRVTKQLRKPNTTYAMFEKADEQTKLMESQ